MDACVAPILDKNILNYIPSNRKKFVEQRDRDLALVQRAMLNAAAPLCCLHDHLESNEDIPKNELLCALQQSLCLLGSANHITTTLRRKKILAVINPDKVQLAEQEYPKAGKLLFGKDLPNLAAKHSELTKSLSKNLQKPYGKTQPYASGNFSRFPSQGNLKYNSQQFRSKSINKPDIPRRQVNNAWRQKPLQCSLFVQGGTSQTNSGPANTNFKTGCTTKTFSFSMANFNSRPNNLEYSSRVSPAISHTTFTNSQTRDVVSKENIPILNAEISKLQLKGAIRPVNFTNAAFYSRLFLVPKKGGDLRPVIDLSALNQFVINEHFQMENISCLKQILNQNDFMVKLDLKDAYLTVGVHEQSQHYLRFI